MQTSDIRLEIEEMGRQLLLELDDLRGEETAYAQIQVYATRGKY